jgi:CubicO group peptidase (beta-lactamase class C family)
MKPAPAPARHSVAIVLKRKQFGGTMKTIHFWPALGLFVLGPADAQVRVAPFPEEKVQAIQQAARAYYDANKIRGMSVAVGYQGRLVYSKGFGLANIKPTYVNGDTIFRLASVSKPVTAILAMALADQGKLDIDKTTRGYFTQLPSLHKHRVRHILTHMSGIRHYIGNDPCSAQNAWFSQMTDASKLFWKDPLLFAPGTKFDYSTHAFTILGGALERATGRTYGQLIERQIAIPNGASRWRIATCRTLVGRTSLRFRAGISSRESTTRTTSRGRALGAAWKHLQTIFAGWE